MKKLAVKKEDKVSILITLAILTFLCITNLTIKDANLSPLLLCTYL